MNKLEKVLQIIEILLEKVVITPEIRRGLGPWSLMKINIFTLTIVNHL